MTGNERLQVTPRDEIVLSECALCRVLDREQIQKIAGFNSVTRANERLLRLTNAGLLKRFFLGTRAGGTKALYTVTKNGAATIGTDARPLQRTRDSLLVGDQFVEHQLAINNIYVQLKVWAIPLSGVRFLRWISFPSVVSQTIPLIPDGYFELESPTGKICCFCEVDRGSESSKAWTKKTSLYLQMAVTGEFTKTFRQQRFRVLILAHSERRMNQLRKTVSKQTEKLFWFATLDDINREGLFSSCWSRPTADGKRSLL
jgi:hypothetical protein